MKIRSSIFFIVTSIFISCSNDDIKPVNEVWSKAQEYYENKDYNNSLVLLHQINVRGAKAMVLNQVQSQFLVQLAEVMAG